MKEKNPLDEYFKQGLEGHETKPSASVWDKIEAGTESEESKKGAGWYLMRAAVVTILIGLSTWVFYQSNSFESFDPDRIDEQHNVVTNTNEKADSDKEQKQQGNKAETGENQDKPKKESKDERVIPIMKEPTRNNTIYVNNEPKEALPEVADEKALDQQENWEPNSIALEVSEKDEVTPVRVKVKLKPATTPAFYTDEALAKAEEKKGFKEKLYAYASDQFDNIKSGKPLELPKADKKPQLEINLGRIFNN